MALLLYLGNPSALDIAQAQHKQTDAERPQDNEIQREGHDMLAVDCAVENIDTISYGQYIGKRADKYRQRHDGKE